MYKNVSNIEEQGIHGRLGSVALFSQDKMVRETMIQIISEELDKVFQTMRWWLYISMVAAVVAIDCGPCVASTCTDFDSRWNATKVQDICRQVPNG